MSALLFDARINSDQLNKDVARVNSTIRDMTDDIKTEGNKMEGLFAKIGAGIASYFAVGSLSNFAQEMVRVRGEFQKFEAVLTNTLDGDNVRASSLLEGLSEFAAKTPYQLQDITENFVKLANQGIVLTQQELTKLGDFAAVTGKPIGQLFEAIMDINNPERWKEFGARIQTEGEKVAISFRGQRIEFERTIEGAKNAIAQLGTMKGVEGTMEVISKTLQGQISNFQDAWDRMLNDLGKANEGTFAGLIGGATSLVQNYETVIDSIKGLVVTLGAAKAAQIVYNAVLAEQAAVNALVVQSNGSLVASDARAVLWKGRLVAAQQALNKSMLANPYVLAVAGITALITGIVTLNKRFNESIDAKKKYDERTKQMGNTYDTEKQKVSELVTKVKDVTEAESNRIRALKDLQTMYPDIFGNLDIHSAKLANLAEMEKLAMDALAGRTLEEQKNFVLTLRSKQAELQRIKAEAKSAPIGAYDGTLTPETWDVFREKELVQVSAQLSSEVERYNQMLSDRMNAEKATREESEKTIQQRIAEAKSIDALSKVQEEWQQKIKGATSDTDRTKLQSELSLINAALDRMSGKGKDKDKETPAEKVAKDLAKKREEYEAYYTAVDQMGREWADKEYDLLLKQGENYQRYLENRLKANRDNMVEVLEIVKAASSADVDMLPSLMTPIKTTGVKERDKATGKYVEPMDTKQLQQSVGNMSKLARWAAAIKSDIKEWDMEDIANGAQQTSQFFGELAYQVRDIDAGLADVLDNIGGIFSNVANIASGNILQQIAGVTGLMTQMYTMAMDTSGIEDRLAKPWEEFEKWIAASNRGLQQYIKLRDQAIGEARYSETDNVIEQTKQDIAETEEKLRSMKLSWTISADAGTAKKAYDELDKKVKELGEKLGVTLSQEGNIRDSRFFHTWLKGVFTANIENLVKGVNDSFDIEKINDLINQGVITDQKVIEAVDAYNQLLETLTQAEQEKQKLLTATLAANVTDSIVEGFRNGQRTAEEFADSFEELMRNALLNVMKVKMLEPQIAKWADDFEEAMADQLLSDSEKQSLKAEWDRIISTNAAYLQGLEQTAGIVTDAAAAADTTGLAGAIKGITEETAGMIAGQMYAIREHMASLRRFQAGEQLDIMNQTVTHLAEIASNTRHNQKLNSIDDRLKDTNAYLKALL